jgi:CheY-like chemotaxis protein
MVQAIKASFQVQGPRYLAGSLIAGFVSALPVSALAASSIQTTQQAFTSILRRPSLHGDFIAGLSDASMLAIPLLILLVSLSIFGWRERLARRKENEAEKKSAQNAREIDVIARKLQQRLPDNRVVRDRISDVGPRIRSKPAESFTAAPFNQLRNPNQPKVLVIDESREARASLANQLGRYYSILESKDLNEALRIVRIARPALLVMGMQNSKHDAIAFSRKLKSDSALWHIPILVLIAKKANNDAMQLIKATDDYLVTPLQPDELLIATETLVNVRAYLKQGGLNRPEIKSDDSTTQISDAIFLDAVHTVVENNLANSLFGLELLAQEVNPPAASWSPTARS